MGLLDRIREGTFIADDAPALATPGRRETLRDAGTRVRNGEDVLPPIRDVLDQAGRAEAHDVAAMIAEDPGLTANARADALIGGVAEYLATARGIPCPAWASAPERFLDRFWFVSAEPGFRAIALAQTPVALKRRGIFWPARSLRRI